ncbi:protease inhibitor Inh/omp19 family protein [Consotaella aegiceratis]|uniref:protease inhibitor Inh/omp19 family protein n=1 Tax=Consotaella aegiceratis TaxID=3097961 RepID=UPI002F3ED34F
MTRTIRTSVALAALLAIAGCTRSMPTMSGSSVAPLPPAPSAPVTSQTLPPPPPPAPATPDTMQNDTMTDAAPGAGMDGTPPPGASQPTQTASAGPDVTRESMVGAWKVSSGGGDCQIFMALTQWTGGYRAASRGCPGQIADVSAWDVSGSQVVLKDSSGGTVAQLSSSGGNRFSGQTSSGQSVSLYR